MGHGQLQEVRTGQSLALRQVCQLKAPLVLAKPKWCSPATPVTPCLGGKAEVEEETTALATQRGPPSPDERDGSHLLDLRSSIIGLEDSSSTDDAQEAAKSKCVRTARQSLI